MSDAVKIGPPVKLTVKRLDPTVEELLHDWPLGESREMMIQTGEEAQVRTFIKTSESISLQPDENGKYPATFEFAEDISKGLAQVESEIERLRYIRKFVIDMHLP